MDDLAERTLRIPGEVCDAATIADNLYENGFRVSWRVLTDTSAEELIQLGFLPDILGEYRMERDVLAGFYRNSRDDL